MCRRKGYHSRAVLRALNDSPWKTRIAAPKQTGFSRWHGDERRGARSPTIVRGSSPGRPRGLQAARRDRRALLCHNLDRGGMRRTWLRARECAQAIPAPRRRPQSIVTDAPAHRAGTPREAVREDMAVFSFCSRPPGPCWWHGGSAKRPDGFRRRMSSSGGESRKKPLNQRAVKGPAPARACPASRGARPPGRRRTCPEPAAPDARPGDILPWCPERLVVRGFSAAVTGAVVDDEGFSPGGMHPDSEAGDIMMRLILLHRHGCAEMRRGAIK